MMPSLNYNYWEFWEAYNPPNQTFGQQKVTFDGDNKLILINPGEAIVSVKEDIYSGWKEWIQVRDNAKYLDALRTTGGDPVGGGLYAGDIYFTINGWKIVVSEQTVVNGVVYDDTPGESPFIVQPGGGVRNVVSNLAYAYNTTGVTVPTVEDIRVEMDTNSSKLISINDKVQTLNNAPSAQTVAVAVRAELSPELAHLLSLQNGQGLNSTQATMLLEIYRLYGLDPTRPLVVTKTARVAGAEITQNIITNDNQTTVTRV